IFYTLEEVRVVVEGWRQHYNTVRPPSSLGYRPPAPEAIPWPGSQPRPSFAGHAHGSASERLPPTFKPDRPMGPAIPSSSPATSTCGHTRRVSSSTSRGRASPRRPPRHRCAKVVYVRGANSWLVRNGVHGKR